MMVVYPLAQAFIEHMSIDLGGGNIGMTEQLLHRAKVGTAFQKMRGKSVAQHMGRDVFGWQSRLDRNCLQFLHQPLTGQMAICTS